MPQVIFRLKGGPGSGFYGHEGRPGMVGGSDNSPFVVYHGTSEEVANLIMKDGLKRSKSRHNGRPRSVYFTESIRAAQEYGSLVGRWLRYAVIEFEAPDKDVWKKDTVDRRGNTIRHGSTLIGEFGKKSWRVEQDIPADFVKAIHFYSRPYAGGDPVLIESIVLKEHKIIVYTVVSIDESIEKQYENNPKMLRRTRKNAPNSF